MAHCGLRGLDCEQPKQFRVRDLVRYLLQELADEDLKTDWNDSIAPEAVRAWWDRAREIGEVGYMLANVLPKESKSPNRHLLWLLMKKHPQHLQTVYRTILEERPYIESELVAYAISHSELPQAKKVELFAYGGRNESRRQREVAFEILRTLDHEFFIETVLKMLDELPRTPKGSYWRCPEQAVVSLVLRTDDARVWKALQTAARRVDVGLRMQLLHRVSGDDGEKERRPQRLVFLKSFLDDTTLRDVDADPGRYVAVPAGDGFPRLEVRNLAALELAELLKLDRKPQPNWDAEQWARFRDEVREALKR
jgi:hypothetical protein